jgi:hypothetical protein
VQNVSAIEHHHLLPLLILLVTSQADAANVLFLQVLVDFLKSLFIFLEESYSSWIGSIESVNVRCRMSSLLVSLFRVSPAAQIGNRVETEVESDGHGDDEVDHKSESYHALSHLVVLLHLLAMGGQMDGQIIPDHRDSE